MRGNLHPTVKLAEPGGGDDLNIGDPELFSIVYNPGDSACVLAFVTNQNFREPPSLRAREHLLLSLLVSMSVSCCCWNCWGKRRERGEGGEGRAGAAAVSHRLCGAGLDWIGLDRLMGHVVALFVLLVVR